MVTVGCVELVNDRILLAKVLKLFEDIESSSTAFTILFPSLPSPARIRRLVSGTRLYFILKELVDARAREGRTEEDPLQFLIDSGDTIPQMIEFIMSALVAGLLNSGINACCEHFEILSILSLNKISNPDVLAYLAQSPIDIARTKESSEFAHRFRAVVFPAMSYYYLLLLFPLTCYLLLTRLDPRRPSFLSSTIPFLGSAIPFFTRRWDFITNGIRNQRNGVFRFNLAHLQVIGVGSKEGIEAFFNTKQFSLADGYAILFGSPTAAHEIKSLDKNTQDEAGKGFNRRLIALMKRERFLAQVRRFSPRLYCRRTASIEVTPRSRAD